MSRAPVFIIGYKRSGTTMLRLMLNNHEEIAIPPESEFFQKVPRALGHGIQSRERLSHVAKKLTALSRCDFELGLKKSDYEDILSPVLPCAAPGIIEALYRHWAALMGKPEARWGDKKPQHWKFVPTLARWYPDSQFVHITRDPRDVFASIDQHFPRQIRGRRLVGPHITTAWQWRACERSMRGNGRQLGPQRYLHVDYEGLAAQPEREAKRICDYLGISFKPSLLRFQEAAHDPRVQRATAEGEAHANTLRAINTERVERSTRTLAHASAADIEYICESEFRNSSWRFRAPRVGRERARVLRIACSCLDAAWKVWRTTAQLRGSI